MRAPRLAPVPPLCDGSGPVPKVWQRYTLEPAVVDVPGMLAVEERQFLYHLARDVYRDYGEILDIGAFLGASACALAAGLRDNPRPIRRSRRIRSYDFFTYGDFYAGYVPEGPWKNGDDTLPVFRRHTAPFAESIEPVPGDICVQQWDGQPIDILFLDFTQAWDHHQLPRELSTPTSFPARPSCCRSTKWPKGRTPRIRR